MGTLPLPVLADSHSLETVEWLARLLGPPRAPGEPGTTEQARALLAQRDLVELSQADPAELEAELGLDAAGAWRLAAAFALGRGLAAHRRPQRPSVRRPEAVFELLGPRLRGLEVESFFALTLDGKHRLRRLVPVSRGTLTTSLVHPREVFRPAIREAAAAVIVAHNHPSGDPEPSAEDLEVTQRLRRAGELLGIPLLDHVVLGEGVFVSLRERDPGWGQARSSG